MVIVGLPCTEKDASSVGCSTARGTGTEIGCRPQTADAWIATDRVLLRILVNDIETESVTVTLMNGFAIVPNELPGAVTPVTLEGKLTLTLLPEYPFAAA